MHQHNGLFSGSKVFHTTGRPGQKYFFAIQKYSLFPTREPGCQLVWATGPNARSPDSSNRTGSNPARPQKCSFKLHFRPITPLLCLFDHKNQILSESQIFDLVQPDLTMTDLGWKGSRPLTLLTPHMSTFPIHVRIDAPGIIVIVIHTGELKSERNMTFLFFLENWNVLKACNNRYLENSFSKYDIYFFRKLK